MGEPEKQESQVLTAEQILAAEDRRREWVDVPEWNGRVLMATMSGEQRDELEISVAEAETVTDRVRNYRARIIAACAIKEDGTPLFTFEQVEALGKKASSALDRLATVANRLNRISAAEVEDIVKN